MQIRPLAEEDVTAVVGLFARVSPEHGWPTREACETYFHETLFAHPWRDMDLPSWVAEDGARIVGFYALIPRPMTLAGRTLRVAVACQITVDPEPRYALAALKLVQACLAGPQDLTLADGAHDRSRRMWLGIGGAAPPLYNLQWIRLLRPARYALALLGEHAAMPPVATLAARPFSATADVLASRLGWNRFLREQDSLTEEDLDCATMLANLSDVLDGATLAPVYDARSLEWILGEARRKTGLGTLRARIVRNAVVPIGWYLYYLRPGTVSEVVQIAAREGAFDEVLQRLLADAWREGAAAVRGRVDPRHIDELSARHCWFRREGTCLLVHSRHAAVREAIQRGDAFLSRLEGEWCLRFLDG